MTRNRFAVAFTMAVAVLLLATRALSSRERAAPSTPAPIPAREASPTTAPSPAPAPALRLFVTTEGNSARYLVREQLVGFDLPNDAIGTTNAVTGAIAFDANGAVIPGESKIVVGVGSLQSDKDRRDGFVRGRLLETHRFPSAELAVTRIRDIQLPLPTSGSRVFSLDGNLTVHGVTHPTTWNVAATFSNTTVTGTAATRFTFADLQLAQPRVPVLLSVSDTIRLEYQFSLQRDTALAR